MLMAGPPYSYEAKEEHQCSRHHGYMAVGCAGNPGPWAPAALKMCPCLRQPRGFKAGLHFGRARQCAVSCLPPVLSKLQKKPAKVRRELLCYSGLRRAKAVKTRCRSALGEAEGVEDASGVAVLAGALEEALQAHKGALLGLAAGLLEVLPPLDLHEVVGKDLQGDQRVCSRCRSRASQTIQ